MRFFIGVRGVLMGLGACAAVHADGAEGPGLIWEIAGSGTTVWVAGSMHVMAADDREPPATYRWALGRAGQVMLETDPAEAAPLGWELRRRGQLPEGETLAGRLDGDMRARLEARVGAERFRDFQRMRPLWAALSIAMMEMAEHGAGPEHGLEAWVAGEVRGRGWKVLALETPREQMALLEHFTAGEELAVLRHTLESGGNAGEELAAMAAAWRAGREEELWRLVETAGEWPEALMERMLYARNRAWVPRVKALLEGTTPALVLVGAAHVAGPSSLVELLRGEGFQPRRLEAVPAVATQEAP